MHPLRHRILLRLTLATNDWGQPQFRDMHGCVTMGYWCKLSYLLRPKLKPTKEPFFKSDKILQQMCGGLETFKPFFLAFLGQKIHSCVFAKQLNFQFAAKALYGLFA